jgi:hypothetical protein
MAGVLRRILLVAPATCRWGWPNHGGGLAPARPPLDPPLSDALHPSTRPVWFSSSSASIPSKRCNRPAVVLALPRRHPAVAVPLLPTPSRRFGGAQPSSVHHVAKARPSHCRSADAQLPSWCRAKAPPRCNPAIVHGYVNPHLVRSNFSRAGEQRNYRHNIDLFLPNVLV